MQGMQIKPWPTLVLFTLALNSDSPTKVHSGGADPARQMPYFAAQFDW